MWCDVSLRYLLVTDDMMNGGLPEELSLQRMRWHATGGVPPTSW